MIPHPVEMDQLLERYGEFVPHAGSPVVAKPGVTIRYTIEVAGPHVSRFTERGETIVVWSSVSAPVDFYAKELRALGWAEFSKLYPRLWWPPAVAQQEYEEADSLNWRTRVEAERLP